VYEPHLFSLPSTQPQYPFFSSSRHPRHLVARQKGSTFFFFFLRGYGPIEGSSHWSTMRHSLLEDCFFLFLPTPPARLVSGFPFSFFSLQSGRTGLDVRDIPVSHSFFLCSPSPFLRVYLFHSFPPSFFFVLIETASVGPTRIYYPPPTQPNVIMERPRPFLFLPFGLVGRVSTRRHELFSSSVNLSRMLQAPYAKYRSHDGVDPSLFPLSPRRTEDFINHYRPRPYFLHLPATFWSPWHSEKGRR